MRFTFFILFTFFTFRLIAGELTLMSYNAQNLFDTNHDEGKNDWTYLPLKYPKKIERCRKMKSAYRKKECLEVDWSESRLSAKLEKINETINLDKRPDIIGLVEVENSRVLKSLASKLGYSKQIISNSPDYRGIDVALLFNESKEVKYISHKEHIITGNSLVNKPTRNILEVEFLVGSDKPLYLFVNHWPSLANPDQSRVSAAKVLKSRIDYLKKQNSRASFVAMGDFNTIAKLKRGSKEHPFRDVLLKDEDIIDIDKYVRDRLNLKDGLSFAKGTYFYKRNKEWNMLDRFFLSSNLLNQRGLSFKNGSYKIINAKKISTFYKKTGEYIPFTFNHRKEKKSEIGYSDHYPILMTLRY